jgi:hypothetical protein
MVTACQYLNATLKVSYGGKILRFSHGGGKADYVGGETKLVNVPQFITLREFHDRLAVIAGCFSVAIWYVSPRETLDDELRDVATEDDLRELLNWALLRDLQIRLEKEDVPHVRVFVSRVDVRPPLPESLFSSVPTTTSTPAASPSCLSKRSASAPSLSANPADGVSNPSVIQRSASASALTETPTNHETTTTAAAAAEVTRGGYVVHDAAAPYPALHGGPADPVFFLPAGPAIVYQPVIPVYLGFPMPSREL